MKNFLAAILLLLFLISCAPSSLEGTPTPALTRTGVLSTYGGLQPSTTPTPTNAATPTPLPTATPTPRTHVVRASEDLWGIAIRYGLTLEDLLTANPTVDPRFLSIGASLNIPAPLYTPTPDPDNPPLPTPIGMTVGLPACYPSAEGGLWCFTTAINRQEYAVEGLSAAVHLYDRASGEIRTLTAFAPLNQVLPGGEMALSAYFSAPLPASFDLSVELLTALPVPPASGRFLSVQQPGTDVVIAPDGLSAIVSGTFQLGDSTAAASRLQAAAIAYAADGRVTGIRQWELNEPLSGTAQVDFSITVYAAGEAIDRVVVLVEGVPQDTPSD